MTAAEVPELDDTASRALASIILEHTADAMTDGGSKAGAALMALHGSSALPLDVCAAILMVTSWFVGTIGIDPEAIFAAAISLQPDDEPTANDERGHDGEAFT